MSRVRDAREISTSWLSSMELGRLIDECCTRTGLLEATLDVVAIGKASREMMDALVHERGDRVRRRLTICDDESAQRAPRARDVIVGEHPIPGPGSRRAGDALLTFLNEPSDVDATLFLLSGGASSLCVVPAPPLTLDDLADVFEAAMRSGVDITTLNKIRAAISLIAGGGVLRHVTSERSASFVMVDNVVSGAQWVASAMTYDYSPSNEEFLRLLESIDVTGSPLAGRLGEAHRHRSLVIEEPIRTQHENVVVAEPAMMLERALADAQRRGYHVIDLGSRISGDVRSVTESWRKAIESAPRGPVALVGVGEVTVRVSGGGRGGRCQEFAWLMAGVLDSLGRGGAFVARASDGRDYIDGVAGAWVDQSTRKKAGDLELNWDEIADAHDTYPALKALGQLLEGGHTGWNLCDIYVATLE